MPFDINRHSQSRRICVQDIDKFGEFYKVVDGNTNDFFPDDLIYASSPKTIINLNNVQEFDMSYFKDKKVSVEPVYVLLTIKD